MKKFTFCSKYLFVFCLLLFGLTKAFAQRNYASSQRTSSASLLCLGCTVTNPANAADGNLQTYSTLNVTVGVAAQSWEEVIFPAATKVPANTPVTVKLGSGDNLLDVTLLGGVTLQAYNGNTPVGTGMLASTLASALSSNNQVEVSFTPTQIYDRVRVTLDGGLLAVASSIYLYDAFYNGTAGQACNASIDELHGVSSALLGLGLNLGGVVNPQLAIDGDLTTASTLNAGVALAGAYAQQTVIFQSPSVIGDSVRLTLSIPSALLSAGVLSNISISTFNGNVSNNDTQSFNGALISVRLLDISGANQKVVVTYAPPAVFDRVQLRLGGGIAGVLSSLNFYEAQKVIPRPIIKYNGAVVSNVQLCAGSTATLVANTVPNTTINWYTAATGGSAIATGNSFTTPVLTTTTTYYVAAMRTGCTDESDRTPVTVTVNQIPAAPVIANNAVAVCPGQQATFVATAVSGVTVNWYTAATGGTPVGTGNTFTTGALTATTTYYAEAITGGTCPSPSRTLVTATVSALPATPTLTASNVTICDGDAGVLSIASPVNGVTYNWYATATGGTILYTGINFTSPGLHATTSYYAEAVNGTGCNSTQRVQGTVTVIAKPSDPVLTANNLTVAAGQTVTITVSNAQTGVTYNWYTTSTAATPVFTGTTYTTPALYSGTTYYVSGVNSNGCTSTNRTPVTISVTINNNSPCTFASTQSNSVSGGLCVLCSVNNPLLATDADTTTASTLTVSAGLVGAFAEQQLGFATPGLAGDTIRLGLQSAVSLADVGVAGNIQVTLYNGAVQVGQYTLDNSLIKLRLLSGGGGRYDAYIPAVGAYDRIVIRLNSGVATLLTSLNVYYAVQQFPKPVYTPASPEICKGSSATINVTSPATGTFNFFSAPTGGATLYTGTSFVSPALTANTTYYIEYTRGTCTSPVRYPVTVLVNDQPVKPTVNPTTATIYSGHTASFIATPPTNATVNWYTAATGGTPIFTGNNFTTPVLTANTDYYAESSLGNCVSPDRTHVNVVVNPLVIPDVAVNPPTQAINAGTSATLTATSTTPGTVFNWYTTPTGGTSVFTGPTYNTPAIFGNTTYYAQATVTATGAVSTTRAAGVITVNSTANNPTACDAAIDQTTANSGLLCVGCTASNVTGAVDADRNTFSQLSVIAGVLNAYEQQTLRFANTGHAGDSVVVELGFPGSLADVSVLSSISLATYNGTIYNNDRFNVNGSLISVSLLSGTSRFRIAFKAGADFDRVEIRLNSTLLGVLNSLNIYDAAQEVAAPTVSAATVTTCQGSQATLTATAPSYATVKWYTTATGGAPVFTGSVFNTPALTATTTYYTEASRTADGCAQTTRTPVVVNVTPIPAAPVVPTPTVTVCSGNPATFTATPVSGITFNWYSAATGGTPLATGNSFTTPALTATTSYYVEAANGGCTNSTRTLVTANVNGSVNDPSVAQTAVAACSGTSAILTATSTQPGVTFNWYTAATGGTPVFTGAQYTTPALTANTSYYVDASSGTCTSPDRIKVDVTVNPTPNAPTVTINPAGGQVTSGQTATLTAASTTAGATFNWYTTATGGTPVATGSSFTTPVLTSNTTYYVESALATGCTSTRTTVQITVNPVFSTTCDFASTQTTDVNGGAICVGCTISNPNNAVDNDLTNYSTLNIPVGVLGSYVSQTLQFAEAGAVGDTVSVKLQFPSSILTAGLLNRVRIGSYNGTTYNNDGIFLDNNLIKLQVLSGGTTAVVKFAPGAAFDRVEIRLTSAVLSAFNSVDVGYASKQVEAPQLAANTVNICAGATATFTVSNARAGVSYAWYDAPTGGNLLHTGATYTTGALTATTTVYAQSTRTVNSCPNPNRVAATANVTPAPVNPVLAQTAVQLCAGDNVILSVTNAGTATVNWYDAATGGNLVFTGANFQVTPLTTTTYYAELTSGTCTSPARTLATVTVNPRPAKPGVQSANVSVCAGSTATLQVLTPEAGVTYNWFTTATGGASAGSGATFTTPAITANTTYYVQATATAGSCVNNGGRTQVNINTSGTIANPTLSATATQVCSGGSATLSVVNPVNGLQYNWYTAATGGAPVFTGTTFTINNLTANASYFVEADNASGCASAGRTETDITVQPIPTAPTVQAGAGGLSVCQGASASISISAPQANQVYRWYDAATGGTLLFTGTQFNTPALSANTTYYVEAATAGNCNPSARTAVTITVNPLPSDPSLVTANVLVCAGSKATFAIASPQAGVTYQWYDSPAQTNLLFTGTTFVTPALAANTTYYVSATNASGCAGNNLATAQAAIQAQPAAPVVANGNTVPDCSGSAVTLTITNPQAGYTYNWYNAATGGTMVATGTSFTTGALTTNTTYYAEAVNSTGCSSSARTQVTINVNPLPAAPAVTAQGGSSTPSVCSGSSAVLNATSTTANVTFNWYSQATGGTIVATGASFTTPALTAGTTYYVEAVSNTGTCSSATRTAVTITVNPQPATPTLTAGTVTICTGSAATLSVASPVAGTVYKWYDSSTRTTLLFTGSTYVTGAISANTTFYVDATSGTCNSALATAQVNVQVLPAAPVVANGSTAQDCSGSAVTLTIANPVAGSTYNWYSAATGGTLAGTGTSFTTPTLTANTTYYAEAVNSTGCSSSARTAVNINVNPIPVAPTVTAQGGSSTPTICSGTSSTLTATSTTANVTFNWYAAATGGTPIFTGAVFTTPALTATTTYYVEAVSNTGACTSATRTAVTVTVAPQPNTPVPVSATVNVCSGNAATVAVASPIAGVTYRWYDSAAKTNLLFTGVTYVTGPISANTTFYVDASSGSCTSSSVASVQVNVSSAPGAPLVTNASVSTCGSSQVVLTIANPQSGFTYNWYSAATGGTNLSTGSSFTTPALTASTTYYAEASNATGCTSTSRTPVAVTILPAPSAPTVSTAGTEICAGGATTISATGSDGSIVIKWYAAATGGIALATGSSFTTPVLNTTTAYYAEAMNVGGCTSATRTVVVVTVRQPITAPVVSVASTTVNSITFQWAAVTGANGYQVSINGGATFITPSSGANGLTHIVTGLTVNQSVTIIVKALGTIACQLSANSNAVTGTSANPFGDGIFVPNAFTPNGDGNNDILYVYGNTIKGVNFTIYDQYGGMLFHADRQANGWDGTYKGNRLPVGVYVYYLEATLNDGIMVKKKGSITLLR